jgi:D-alanyl-lipoteichoic acid acyltransferase DltB (MBOAT superfamily)
VPYYLIILFAIILIDYFSGIYIDNNLGIKRKLFLALSLFANISILGLFKYYNFFIENTTLIFSNIYGTNLNLPYLNIILPIGLSFHTFQAMSYTIEVYKGNVKAERHIGIYALYVLFYPQLVAGPIERPQNLIFQFREYHKYSSQNLLDGLRLMFWGFFKKLVIADRLSIYVNTVYENPGNYHYLNLIIASIMFSIQIYCDFSGYSDIAIGSARTMGFDLMTNFNRPYFSKNIQEFWQKWHISLSTWFKDYVYIPLGGNKGPLYSVCINIGIIFMLSGLWHGANWTFIIWGILHAIFIILYLIFKRKGYFLNTTNSFIAIISCIFLNVIVVISWIFFRAESLPKAVFIIKRIFSRFSQIQFQLILKDINGAIKYSQSSILFSVISIFILFQIEYKFTPKLEGFNSFKLLDIIFITTVLVLILVLGVFNGNSFIYFQF